MGITVVNAKENKTRALLLYEYMSLISTKRNSIDPKICTFTGLIWGKSAIKNV